MPLIFTHIYTLLQGSSLVDAVDNLPSTLEAIHATLQCRLLKVQAAMKATIDSHRRDVQFSVGD